MSRRAFLKTGATAALGLAIVPGTVLGKNFGHAPAPSDKLNILGVGVGGRGASVLKGLESQNIIGLCDVDWKYADHVFQRYPAAKKYNDYRKMLDEKGYKYEYYETGEGHIWKNWRIYLTEFVPMLFR